MYSDIPLSPCGKEEEEEKKKMANLALWLRSQQPLSEQLRGLGITATASSAVFNHFQKFEREGFFFFFFQVGLHFTHTRTISVNGKGP